MNELVWILGPLTGFLGMMAGGYWGVGCGWIMVPAMMIAGLSPLDAVAVGLLQMVPSTLITVIRQAPEITWGKGSPGRSLALPIGIGAALTSLLGKRVNHLLIDIFGSARPMQWMLIFCIGFIAVQTLCSRTKAYGDAMPPISPKRSRTAFGMGVFTGLVSSMLGLGGGIFIRPLLTSGFHVPEYYTSRIVRMLVLVTTVTGGLTYLFNPDGFASEIFFISMASAVGGILGFPLGAKMHKTVYDAGYAQHIHKSFAFIALAIPLNTILSMYGFAVLSRYLMLLLMVVLALYLFLFTWYAGTHPVQKRSL